MWAIYCCVSMATMVMQTCHNVFMVTPCINEYPTLYCPTNAHNVKHMELLKHIKIMEAAPTCFGLQGNHHQGATDST